MFHIFEKYMFHKKTDKNKVQLMSYAGNSKQEQGR